MRVLLIGASGNFGSKLAKLLSQEAGITLIAGGRTRASLDVLASEYGCAVAVIERDMLTSAEIAALKVDLVIDASGPFQRHNMGVIKACIAARVHYCDIADGRAFVAQVSDYDAQAKAANVAVISGASSTPALSDAVVRHLTKGWAFVDSIRVTISPSNRQKRGRAVVAAILAGVGQRIDHFVHGAWRTSFGWGSMKRITMPGVGRRWASLCDTPDLDLLFSRHRPRVEASFYASLELPVMHLGLSFLGWLVRMRILRSVLPLAAPLSWIADQLEHFGNDHGGMVVDVLGQARGGTALRSRWWLAAQANRGPHVPILAALATVRQLRDGVLVWRGASPCVGFIDLSAFEDDFKRLGIITGTQVIPAPPALFKTALGDGFAQLPAPTQAIHSPAPTLIWHGEGTAERGTRPLARLIARLFHFPDALTPVPLRIIIEQQADGSEQWHRIWPNQIMHSIMKCAGPGTVEEHFGPFAFVLRLNAHRGGINMALKTGRVYGVRLPRLFMPRITATERAEPGGLATGNLAKGRHLFDVDVTLPLVGRLVRYQGWLSPDCIT